MSMPKLNPNVITNNEFKQATLISKKDKKKRVKVVKEPMSIAKPNPKVITKDSLN